MITFGSVNLKINGWLISIFCSFYGLLNIVMPKTKTSDLYISKQLQWIKTVKFGQRVSYIHWKATFCNVTAYQVLKEDVWCPGFTVGLKHIDLVSLNHNIKYHPIRKEMNAKLLHRKGSKPRPGRKLINPPRLGGEILRNKGLN